MIDTSIVRVHQRELPFEVRRDQLDSLGRRRRRDHLQRGDRGRRRCRVAHACKLGVEGIVSKRLGGVYSSGRCRNWLKVRNAAFERR